MYTRDMKWNSCVFELQVLIFVLFLSLVYCLLISYEQQWVYETHIYCTSRYMQCDNCKIIFIFFTFRFYVFKLNAGNKIWWVILGQNFIKNLQTDWSQFFHRTWLGQFSNLFILKCFHTKLAKRQDYGIIKTI